MFYAKTLAKMFYAKLAKLLQNIFANVSACWTHFCKTSAKMF